MKRISADLIVTTLILLTTIAGFALAIREIGKSDIKPGLQHCIWQIQNAIRDESPDYESTITCKEGDAVIKFYNHPKPPVIEMPELRSK